MIEMLQCSSSAMTHMLDVNPSSLRPLSVGQIWRRGWLPSVLSFEGQIHWFGGHVRAAHDALAIWHEHAHGEAAAAAARAAFLIARVARGLIARQRARVRETKAAKQ